MEDLFNEHFLGLSEGEFQSEVLANTPALAIDPHSRKIINSTAEAQRIFKCKVKNGLNGTDYHDRIPEALREIHKSHEARYLSDPHPRPMGATGAILSARDLDGNEFPAAITLAPFKLKRNEKLYMILIILPLPNTKGNYES